MDDIEVAENMFNLIFAFDEIVALGYRENVNLAQVRTFVEMDSHEERVYEAVRKTQEREAKNKMREKAKELQLHRMMESTNKKSGIKSTSFSGGYGSGSAPASASVGDTANFVPEPIRPSYKPKQYDQFSKHLIAIVHAYIFLLL
jgi:hypothetical protein